MLMIKIGACLAPNCSRMCTVLVKRARRVRAQVTDDYLQVLKT